jgi:hypothetical protein
VPHPPLRATHDARPQVHCCQLVRKPWRAKRTAPMPTSVEPAPVTNSATAARSQCAVSYNLTRMPLPPGIHTHSACMLYCIRHAYTPVGCM